MENLSLLSLLILLAASPLVAAAWSSDSEIVDATTWSSDSDIYIFAWSESGVGCGGNGRSYAANSTYEANLHSLAAVLPAAASAAHGRTVDRAIGYWPNRVQASATCWSGDDGDCATCVAEAFKKVELECPFSREASFNRDCYLRLSEFRIFSGIHVFRRNTMFEAFAVAMMFQAFGLACIFFMFIYAWRHDSKKGTMTRHTPLLSGDQFIVKTG